MKLRAHHSRAGFTIMEALIASMILGLALTSVLAVSSHAFRYLTDIRLTARSSQVLQQKMEDLRLLSWTDLHTTATNFTDHIHPATFHGKVTFQPYDTWGSVTSATRVTLFVTWETRNATTATNSLSSIIANGGLNKYIF